VDRRIKVAFASGPDDLNRALVERMRALFPELPLYVVSEFPPAEWGAAAGAAEWIPYHVSRSFAENLARCRAAWRGKRVRLGGVLLVPRMPYRRMRAIALAVSPAGFLAFNENLDSFMLRPRCAGTIARHIAWRISNFLRWQTHPGGHVYTFFWRLRRPREWRVPLRAAAARLSGAAAALLKLLPPARELIPTPAPPPAGITVVIPSRNGKHLLQSALPPVLDGLSASPSEVIVVDNGSDDGTLEWLEARHPQVIRERSAAPLSFAQAVNLGIARARFSHLCLLNNDMIVEPGFFHALRQAFDAVPDLFCATAQIFFPAGARREETGKAVWSRTQPTDFPVRCETPVEGEDHSYVLYGSGGCSLYETAKLRALGCVGEIYQPAYVEDLDLGYRAWQRGWPTVFAAGAKVEHRHRATTSRYYSPHDLDRILEINYLRFLCRAVASPKLFRRLWSQAIRRLHLNAAAGSQAASEALAFASRSPWLVRRPARPSRDEAGTLELTGGSVAVFPGRAPSGKPRVLVASPYLSFPLSHGGAVRMYNLMLRAAADFDQVLVAFADSLSTPPTELLEICAEIVVVRRQGSHSRPSTQRPDVVEEFDSASFRGALAQTVRKWSPAIAQLEFTQMGQYASQCRPAKTILVEHDVTFDLYEQMLRLNDDWEMRRQLERWRRFEPDAWRDADCVVTMSEKDRALVGMPNAAVLPNGVDLLRFHPSPEPPGAARLLFIGSFAHLPNLLALEFFLREIWPRLPDPRPALHVIAGARHEYFLRYYGDRVRVDLALPGIEVEGFVADVRPAYSRATLVLAPLVASAGTNIKIMEAMAMGKAIVATPAGVNGLDSIAGVTVASGAEDFARAVRELLSDPARRIRLERDARAAAERDYDWDAIARRQRQLYESLIAG
jgi:GT2 family glycosyltransferase/glycosyltransferase involved in cell wall biosynthesis